MDLSFTDEVTYGCGSSHNLHCGQSTPGFLLEQGLGKNPFDGFGKLRPNLCLLVGRENVYDPVYRVGCAGGVNGTENT